MILPSRVFELKETLSTQRDAKSAGFGIFWTSNQTLGKGRYDRKWFSNPGESLAISICFEAYRGHLRPYLIGMAVALAVAEEFGLSVQWPNDLVFEGKKVAGILTEVHDGLIIVGMGLNLAVSEFPEEINCRATSLSQCGLEEISPALAAQRTIAAIEAFEPTPIQWEDLKSRWEKRDQTPGKPFRLTDGRLGSAVGVDDSGALLWTDGVSEEVVSVGEALWGDPPSK